MLYFIVVTATMSVTVVTAAVCSVCLHVIPLWQAFVLPAAVNVYVLALMGLLCFAMRLFIPKSFWERDRKCFRVSRREIAVYERMKIRLWKDKVPEWGRAGGFPKDHIRSSEPEYLQKFIAETRFAEWMHFTVGLAGFTALFFCPPSGFVFVLPVLLVNLGLHLLPCMIQRYNRFRLTKLLSCSLRRQTAVCGNGAQEVRTAEGLLEECNGF